MKSEKKREDDYLDHPDIVRDILNDGATKVRKIADTKMAIVRDAVGIL